MGAEKELCPAKGKKIQLNLTVNQRICLLFILPTALHCIVYIADIATDIAMVERHYGEMRYIPAVLTLIIIYAPAIVYLVLTLTDKKQRPKSEKESTEKWIFKQILLAIFFPIQAMHRFAGKLFWGLEAIYGPREQKEDSLAEAMKPSFIELYLLLQPFLQAIPQALLQTYIIMTYKVPQERTGAVQAMSVTTSLLSIAIAAAVYMRFETKRSAGKPTPWAYDERPRKKKSLGQKESLMTTIESQIAGDGGESSPQPPDSPKTAPLPKGVPQTAILSLPPLPPNIRARLLKASGDELPDGVNESLVDGKGLNIRSSLYSDNAGGQRPDMESLDFSITLPSLSPAMKRAISPDMSDAPPSPVGSLPPSPLPPLPPSPPDGSPLHEPPLPPLPDSPPPSPEQDPDDESYDGSVHEAPTNEVTGTTTPDTNLAEHPSRERLIEQSTESIDIKPTTPCSPVRQKDLAYIGVEMDYLDEEEMIGKGIAFFWWFCFVLSRILALSTLAFFYPVAFGIVAGVHYLGMTSYLFSCGETDVTSTKVLRYTLGVVFLFCFIEIRDRFRDARSFAIGFVVLCSLENVVSSMVWFLLSAWTSWWFLYTFYVINVSLMLSILAMGLFHMILKPTNVKN